MIDASKGALRVIHRTPLPRYDAFTRLAAGTFADRGPNFMESSIETCCHVAK